MKKFFKLLLLLSLYAGKMLADTEPDNNLPGTTTDAINIGGGAAGSLGPSDSYDYYQLTNGADGNITINAANDNNAYIYIYLYDSDGTTQLAVNSGYALSGISLTATGLQAGNYYAMIYCTSPTNYTLTAVLNPPVYANDAEPNNIIVQATALTLGNTVSGHLAYRANGGTIDNYDYYKITSTADGDIVVNLSNDNNAYCYVYLMDEDGVTQLSTASGYAAGGISLTGTGLSAGNYYIQVYGSGYCGYTLTPGLNPNPIPNDPASNSYFINAPSFAQNDSTNGHIAYRNNGGSYDNYDYYSFYSSGDYDITISLKNNNNAYAYIYLYDTDTVTQLGSTSGYAQGGISFTASGLAAGTYYIMVYSGGGNYSGYTLKNTYTPNPLAADPEPNNTVAQANPLNVNSSTTGHIAYRNTGGGFDINDYYQITTVQDGNLQLSLSNTNNAYTYLYLLDNDGITQLGSTSGYAQSGISFSANGLAAGTYYVLVYASGGSYSGYTLSNTLTSTPYANDTEDNGSFATAQPLNNSPVKTGHIGHRYNGGAYDLYDYRKISMLNPDSLRLELTFSGSNYTYVYLYNAAQNQLYVNSGFGGSYVIFFNNLPAGDYYLVVYSNSYNSYLINKFYYPCDPAASAITAGGPTTFCQGGSVGLNISGAYNNYLWTTGSTTGSIAATASGSYFVTAYDFDGCPHISNSIAVTVLPNATWYADNDGDNFGNPGSSQVTCTGAPSGYVADNSDCNDGNSFIYPAAPEVCNGIDDDCDGATDDGLTFSAWYADADGDNFGNTSSTTSACSQPSGFVSANGDCDDNNGAVNPGASELCNGIDDDCDGSTDEGCGTFTWYADTDGDSYGDPSNSTTTSNPTAPSGYVANNLDCNDNNNAINPAVTEACNGIDDDCDGTADDGLAFLTYYTDADGDNFGSSTATGVSSCSAVAGSVTNNGDCNDNNGGIKPGAVEVCNTIDDDCDGNTDEGLTFITYYADTDGDTYGNASSSAQTCNGTPSGYVANNTDCNDNNGSVNPGAAEACNGIDDNCDGTTDEGCGGCGAPGPISGPVALCAPTGQQITYSVTAIPGALSYNWTVPGGTIIVSGQGTNTLVVKWPFQSIHSGLSGDICVNYTASCGTSAPSCLGITVQLTAPVRPASVSGPNKACAGDLFTYSTALVPRATGYNWTVPAGANIQSGNGSNIITVLFDASFAGGQISVSAFNGCGSSPQRVRDISRNILRAPASINGLARGVCGALGVGYTCSTVTGASSYQWVVPAGATIASGQGSNSITVNYSGSFTSGQVSVYAINNCGGGAPRSMSVAGAPANPGAVSGPVSTCTNQSYTYEVQAVPGAANYNWILPSHLQIVSGQGTKTLVLQTGNTPVADFSISVKCSNACGTSTAGKLEHISSNVCPRIGNSSFPGGIMAYPNPVSETLHISFQSSGEKMIQVQLSDASGRLVYDNRFACVINENQLAIDVRGLSSGIYNLSIQDENGILHTKIIVD